MLGNSWQCPGQLTLPDHFLELLERAQILQIILIDSTLLASYASKNPLMECSEREIGRWTACG